MSEKNTQNKWIVFFGITIVMLIIVVSLLVNYNQTLKAEMEIIKQIVKSKEVERNGFKGDCETEADSILRKDMEIYIKKRYTKTPRIIAKEISKQIILFSRQYKLSPELILGIIEVESMFNPRLESSAGARGLMQVMTEWVPKLGLKSVNDLHEVDIGIESGIRVFLIHLEEAKGNISGGLFRYVNKDKKYVERVYSSIGRFVTYRTTLTNPEKIVEKEKDSDKTDKRARLDCKRTPEPSIS